MLQEDSQEGAEDEEEEDDPDSDFDAWGECTSGKGMNRNDNLIVTYCDIQR